MSLNLIRNFVNKVVIELEYVLRVRLSEHTVELLYQFSKFIIVGISNSLVSYSIYVITLYILKVNTISVSYDYLFSQFVAFSLSVLWAFYWNQKYVFNGTFISLIQLFRSLIKIYLSYSFTGLFISEILLYLMINVLNMSELVAPIINICICFPINFILNKFWVFKQKAKRSIP